MAGRSRLPVPLMAYDEAASSDDPHVPQAEPALKLTLGELERRRKDFLAGYLRNKSPQTVGTYRRTSRR